MKFNFSLGLVNHSAPLYEHIYEHIYELLNDGLVNHSAPHTL